MVPGTPAGRLCSYRCPGYSTWRTTPGLTCPVDPANPGRHYHWRPEDRYDSGSPYYHTPGALTGNFLRTSARGRLVYRRIAGDHASYSGDSPYINGKHESSRMFEPVFDVSHIA